VVMVELAPTGIATGHSAKNVPSSHSSLGSISSQSESSLHPGNLASILSISLKNNVAHPSQVSDNASPETEVSDAASSPPPSLLSTHPPKPSANINPPKQAKCTTSLSLDNAMRSNMILHPLSVAPGHTAHSLRCRYRTTIKKYSQQDATTPAKRYGPRPGRPVASSSYPHHACIVFHYATRWLTENLCR